jgi:hypothetical protein
VKRIRIAIVCVCVGASVLAYCLSTPLTRSTRPSHSLIPALIAVESSGNDHAIGDTRLSNKAYGCLQIRQPCVDDVNRVHKTTHQAQECLGNRALSVWICKEYLAIYATQERLGRRPSDEDRARIWNGGPNGHKKSSTNAYWAKVKAALSQS